MRKASTVLLLVFVGAAVLVAASRPEDQVTTPALDEIAETKSGSALPPIDEVITNMLQRDRDRRSALDGYTSFRRYLLQNVSRNKEAQMLVVHCSKDGSKDFEIVSVTGWGTGRKHVFHRLLEAESEASGPGSSDDARITPRNYSFTLLRAEEVNGRRAFVIEIEPKKQKKYLMRGLIWVDAQDWV